MMKSRITDLRKIIGIIIENSDTPINAKAIIHRMQARVNVSTIYRALDFLSNKGFIQSIAFFDGTKFYYSSRKHAHFILCNECHEIQQFGQCAARKIQNSVESEFNYIITDHVFYFKGVCSDCRKVLEKKSIFCQ